MRTDIGRASCASAREGDRYRFYVVGEGSSGYKRDPYARELANDRLLPFPVCPAVIRSRDGSYPWHDAGFRAPEFSDMSSISYILGPMRRPGRGGPVTYLDVVEKIAYLVALGVNMVQPLPMYEMEDSPSQGYPGLGYQGADLYLTGIRLCGPIDPGRSRGLSGNDQPPAGGEGIRADDACGHHAGVSQMKAMVDLLHVYGIGGDVRRGL